MAVAACEWVSGMGMGRGWLVVAWGLTREWILVTTMRSAICISLIGTMG